MDYCVVCNSDVTEAKYLLIETKVYKSCPGCSKNAGEHIFYDCLVLCQDLVQIKMGDFS